MMESCKMGQLICAQEGRKGKIPKIRGGSRVHLYILIMYNVPHPLGFTHCKAQGNVITIAKTFEKIPQSMYVLFRGTCDPRTHWFQVQTKVASNNPTTPLMQCSSLCAEPKFAISHTHKQQRLFQFPINHISSNH